MLANDITIQKIGRFNSLMLKTINRLCGTRYAFALLTDLITSSRLQVLGLLIWMEVANCLTLALTMKISFTIQSLGSTTLIRRKNALLRAQVDVK